jgi:formate dehydrogenase major subunit
VQVTKVTQPSEWQQGYTRFNRHQLDLLERRREGSEAGVEGK